MSDETAAENHADAEAPGAESPAPKAKEPKAKAKKADKKSQAKGKGKAKGKSSGGLSVASHPRAHAAVRRAKGWGGLTGFVIAAFLSYRAGVPPEQLGLRALAAGAAGYMVGWAVSVTIWRQILLAEIRTIVEKRKAAAPTGVPIGKHGPKEESHAA